ncbi:MAG: hypothetical protein IPK52_21255 [Chloroflexi bacterium]|nr:hypothetical protein [Chloroflexota bacterium]
MTSIEFRLPNGYVSFRFVLRLVGAGALYGRDRRAAKRLAMRRPHQSN